MFAAALAEDGPLVLDGGLSTELERRGHDLSSALWSARLLRDEPSAIRSVHQAFADAGASVLTTASYQASRAGFQRAGMDDGTARSLIARSVALARSVADSMTRPAWVAGSAGPYGALLADGSEYTGDYDTGPDGLREFHHDQIARLYEAGADVIACETIPSRDEAEAVIDCLESLSVPGWVSLTLVTTEDGAVVTRRGEPADEVFALAAQARHVLAVGVNCTAPEVVSAAVALAAKASGKPVVVYPNSGEGWDASSRSWTGTASPFPIDEVRAWIDAGAAVVGGCCRVTPEDIAILAGLLHH